MSDIASGSEPYRVNLEQSIADLQALASRYGVTVVMADETALDTTTPLVVFCRPRHRPEIDESRKRDAAISRQCRQLLLSKTVGWQVFKNHGVDIRLVEQALEPDELDCLRDQELAYLNLRVQLRVQARRGVPNLTVADLRYIRGRLISRFPSVQRPDEDDREDEED